MRQKSALETTGLTLVLGSVGAVLAWFLGIPAPFLLGPTIVVTLAGLAGLKLNIADPVRDLCFIIIGIAMGSSATPQAIAMAASWPISFVMMIVIVLIVFAAAYLLLFYLFGYDRNTAILAAAPGFMSFIVGLGSEIKSDLVAISIIQSIRVLALTLVVPLLVTVLHLQHPSNSVASPPMPWLAIIALVPLAFLAGLVFKKLHLPAAYLLGGAFISTIAHLNALAVGALPWELSTPAYMAMGCLIGSRFSGVTFTMLKSAFWAGLFDRACSQSPFEWGFDRLCTGRPRRHDCHGHFDGGRFHFCRRPSCVAATVSHSPHANPDAECAETRQRRVISFCCVREAPRIGLNDRDHHRPYHGRGDGNGRAAILTKAGLAPDGSPLRSGC